MRLLIILMLIVSLCGCTSVSTNNVTNNIEKKELTKRLENSDIFGDANPASPFVFFHAKTSFNNFVYLHNFYQSIY